MCRQDLQPFSLSLIHLRPYPEETSVIISHYFEPAHCFLNAQHHFLTVGINHEAIEPITSGKNLPGIIILNMMSISSVLLSAIIKVSATKALSAMRLCPSLA